MRRNIKKEIPLINLQRQGKMGDNGRILPKNTSVTKLADSGTICHLLLNAFISHDLGRGSIRLGQPIHKVVSVSPERI